ncbi:hypothetical protein KQ51_00820 [Candidatus Izimaplasma bacterium HR1]|jgi:hypothetical protein|uniref:hypothetical protein n=1 Tax=Candidatus Izimoplasma sp. HR1 TaxID=1541959 RepID=UPI0004F79BE7|nr:hypothetical protein KQ51_00820 [Candidatus Izimaplasma bacterium HR1]
MRRGTSSLDLLFGVIGLIAEVVESSSRSSNRRGISSYTQSANKGPANALSRLQQMEQDHKTGGGPVYDPMKNKPVKTVSKEDRMAAFAALKSGNTSREIKKSEEQISTETSTPYIVNSIARQVKLEVLLLSYMFEEDDGRISRKEKKAIQKHYKTYASSLDKDDFEYIKDIKESDNSLINIRAYISQQNVTDSEITGSIRTLKECSKSGKQYYPIIERIEKTLLESMGY